MQPNRLAAETSPYLLQHADNPVDWYPWGEEALLAAGRGEQAHSAVHRLFRLPLVPCHGARVLRRPCHGRADERIVHQHQGGSRRAARPRQDLPGGAAADHAWRRRLAADHVPLPGNPGPLLRRHLFSEAAPPGHTRVRRPAAPGRPVFPGSRRGNRRAGRAIDRRAREPGAAPGGRGPARARAAARGARGLGTILRSEVRRLQPSP